MWVDAPIQIDLSRDSSWDQVDDSLLTPEDKSLLKEQFNEESEWIIYLSRQELSELKNTLDATSDPRWNQGWEQGVWESFQEFITDQKQEWLSSSDIFESVEGVPEGLWDTLDALSQEALFWWEGVLKGLTLSDTARDNITTSLSLSILWNIDIWSNFEWDTIAAFENAVANLSSLRSLSSARETVGHDIQKSVLDMPENGERNYIFMDANIGMKFFDTLLSENMSESEIESYIEERNLSPESNTQIVNNIEWLSNARAQNIEALVNSLSETLESEELSEIQQEGIADITDVIDPNDIPSRAELDELKEQKGIFAILAEFFEILLNGMKNLANSVWNDISNTSNNDAPQEIENIPIEDETVSVLWNEDIPGKAEILGNPHLAKQIEEVLKGIDPRKDISEILAELFSTGKYNRISEVFKGQGIFWDNPEDTSPWNQVLKVLSSYKDYRNDPEVFGKTENRPTWDNWAGKQNWFD